MCRREWLRADIAACYTELRTKVRLAVTVNYRKHDGSSEILSHFVLQPGIRSVLWTLNRMD